MVSQFLSLGDLLFLVPLVRKLILHGHIVTWPVASEYLHTMQAHFPDLEFVNKENVAVDFGYRGFKIENDVEYIPFRWADLHVGDPNECMYAKYTIVGADWREWRSLYWHRDRDKEQLLAKWFGVNPGDEFALVSTRFGCKTLGQQSIPLPCIGRTVEVQYVPGFTLLDYAGLIEQASRIDFVSSSILYLIEVLQTKAELHIYPRKPIETDRKPIETDFRYVEKLMEKKYIRHL